MINILQETNSAHHKSITLYDILVLKEIAVLSRLIGAFWSKQLKKYVNNFTIRPIY